MGVLFMQPDTDKRQDWRGAYRRFAGRVSSLKARMPVILFRVRLRAMTMFDRLVTSYRRIKRGARR